MPEPRSRDSPAQSWRWPAAFVLGVALSTATMASPAHALGTPAQASGTLASPGRAMAPVPPLTSTGSGLRKQSVTVAVPAGWRLALLNPTPGYHDVVIVPAGYYALTAGSPTITFTPALGFVGAASPVRFQLTDPAGVQQSATYTATVTLPSPPPVVDRSSVGAGRAAQSVTFEVPAGSQIGYVDANGDLLTDLEVTGKGTYGVAMASSVSVVEGEPFDPTLISATATLSFTGTRGFVGTMPPVSFCITDAYGLRVIATYTATVTGYGRS